MFTLYTYGPYFGLPDASPFCIKGVMLLKLLGLPFTEAKMSFRDAPKGKAPYLVDGDQVIADSHFIMRHLEANHGVDFGGGYGEEKLAIGWAVARMLEEHFYFLSMNIRWLEDDNFDKGPTQFFNSAPAFIRPLVTRIVRNKVRKTQYLQGLGRHSPAERLALAQGDLLAVEKLLGNNKYFLGEQISGVDASVLGFLWAGSCSYFRSPIGDYVRQRASLMAYLTRMRDEFFPGFQL
jgi:glutathione S-transferase